MAIHRHTSLASIVTDPSTGCAGHGPNLSVHVDHAEAAEHLHSIGRLPARSRTGNQSSHDLCRVRHLLSLSLPLASDESSCVIASMCVPHGEFQLPQSHHPAGALLSMQRRDLFDASQHHLEHLPWLVQRDIRCHPVDSIQRHPNLRECRVLR